MQIIREVLLVGEDRTDIPHVVKTYKTLKDELLNTPAMPLEFMHLWETVDKLIEIIPFFVFTFSSHMEYVKREIIVIAWVKKKILSFWRMFMICMSKKIKQAKKKCPSVRLSVCLDVRTYVDFSCGHNNF